MSDFTKLAETGLSGICIALIGVGAWMFKEWLKYMKCQDQRHDKAYRSFQKTISKNTRVVDETYKFLKNLNGSLEKAVKEKKKKI